MISRPEIPNRVSLKTGSVTVPTDAEIGAAMLNFLYRTLRVIGISVGASLALAWVSAAFFQV